MTFKFSMHVPQAFPSGEQTDLPGVGHVPVVRPGMEGIAAGAVDCVGDSAGGGEGGGAAEDTDATGDCVSGAAGC